MKVRLTDPKDGRHLTDGPVVSIDDAKHQLVDLTEYWIYNCRFTKHDTAQQAIWVGTLVWEVLDDDGTVLERGTVAELPRLDPEGAMV